MRKSYFSGSFYDSNCEEIEKYFSQKENLSLFKEKSIRGLIVPHAGYFYSGSVADEVYKITNGENYKRIVVIGPSHHLYFKNASVVLDDYYKTPCGNLDIDIQYSEELIEKLDFLSYLKQAHMEHSTEVQMPFIKHYFSSKKVVEIVYGDINKQKMSELIELILSDKSNLLVISTDLSHFYNLKDANILDNYCIEAFKSLNIEILDDGCEACGLLGLRAVIDIAKKQELKSELVKYKTSADASGDNTKVVGYMSGILFD